MSSSISNNNKTNDQQPYDVQPLLDHAHVQQTVQYDSSNRGNIVDFKPIMDETFSDGHTVRNELADFLSRQVEIFSVTWTEGTRLSTSFAPWRLFFDNPDVKDKLKTYAYIQCDLELQFMLILHLSIMGRRILATDHSQFLECCRSILTLRRIASGFPRCLIFFLTQLRIRVV